MAAANTSEDETVFAFSSLHTLASNMVFNVLDPNDTLMSSSSSSSTSNVISTSSILSPNAIENETFDVSDLENELSVNTKLSFILLGIVGVMLCFVGIIGNIFSIIVLSRKSMKKLSTYSYLFGLAICDEISLIFTVFILAQYSIPPGLAISQSLINAHKILLIYVYPIVQSTQALSVWITLAFTVDRYIFVCHPYWSRDFCNRRRACIVIICLYVIDILYSIPQFFERSYDVVEIIGKQQIFPTYTALGRNKYFIYIYNLFMYSVFVCIVPFLTIFILNGFLVYDIIKSNKRHRELTRAYNPANYLPTANVVATENANGTTTAADNADNDTGAAYLKPSKSFIQKILKKNSSKMSFVPNSGEQGENGAAAEPCLPRQPSSLNGSISRKAPKNKSIATNGGGSSSGPGNEKAFRNDVTIMLIGLIIVFLICQMPSTISRLITYRNLNIVFDPIYLSSVDICNFLIVTNSTLNCILYIILGKKFRKEFMMTFFPKCLLKKSNFDFGNQAGAGGPFR